MRRIKQKEKSRSLLSKPGALPRFHSSPASLSSDSEFSKSSPALMPSRYAAVDLLDSDTTIQFSSSHDAMYPSTNLDFSNDEDDGPSAFDLDKDDSAANGSAGAM